MVVLDAMAKPAVLGGTRAISQDPGDLFRWPIITEDDEQAVLQVLRARAMSGTAITREFEAAWARYQGSKFALAHCNGTLALLAAMYAVGLQPGDELVAPSLTYWASVTPCLLLGARPVFADVDPKTLCIDHRDIERRITPRTRAIMVVHLYGHPCDMHAIRAVADRHRLKVIEDVSHAHGGTIDGRMLGTFGDVAAMSMMTAKSFPVGEGGMLVTDDRTIYERAIAFSHYERTGSDLTLDSLKSLTGAAGGRNGVPTGGVKGRMNQIAAALGLSQLKAYPARVAELQRAMNHFWDLLESVPGIKPHRVGPGSGATMGGWYAPHGFYDADELGGLDIATFCAAVRAEGVEGPGIEVLPSSYQPLHLRPLVGSTDAWRYPDRSLPPGPPDHVTLPHTEAAAHRTLFVPAFRQHRPEQIRAYAEAFIKVASHADEIRRRHGSRN